LSSDRSAKAIDLYQMRIFPVSGKTAQEAQVGRMADNPFTKRLTQVGQNRLETYAEQILGFVEKLEAETPDPFIPMLTDLALAHVLITHLVRQFGPVQGMQESRVAFEDTYEKMKPIMERLERESGEGGTPQ
jgi:hypothetical protein